MIDNANDMVVHETLPNTPTPATGECRTQFQIATLAEATWLAPYIIATDVYICPSEVMERHGMHRKRK